MTFIKKVANPGDTGDADHVGGVDWDKLDDYFDDVDITPKVGKINTRTYYRSGILELRNPANTFSYVLTGSAIAANRVLTLPLLTGGDTIVTEAHTQTLTNKTWIHKDTHKAGGGDPFAKGDDLNASARYIEDIADMASDAQRFWLEDGTSNLKFWSDEGTPTKRTVTTLDQIQTLTNKTIDSGFTYGGNPGGNIVKFGLINPFPTAGTGATLIRSGMFQARSSVGGDGLWAASLTAIGTPTDTYDATEGKTVVYATGASSGANAGLRQTSAQYRRDWSSYHCMRVSFSSTANIRVFLGWSSSNAEVAGEDPLNALHGAGVGKRSADTNWQVIRNDGSGATVFVDTGIPFDTSGVTVEMQLDSTNFKCRIGGVEQTAQTTELPGTTTSLFAHAQIETSAVADKTIQIAFIYSRVGA